MSSAGVTNPDPVFTLHRYFIWANRMRTHFDAILDGQPITDADERFVEAFLYMSYWYGGLYVVIEGWQDLRLSGAEIDRLLTSPNVDLLRRYRNGAFHYQNKYFDNRILDLITQGQDVVDWVRTLNRAFGRYFLEWFERQRAT